MTLKLNDVCGQPIARWLSIQIAIGLAILAATLTAPAQARRVALVIGNATYTQGPLANPVNDAEAIGDALRDLGFAKVIRVQNATKAQMEKALGEMATESAGAEMAVVFFAGHGTERDGRNYLIPVDAKLDRVSDLDLQAIALPTVLDQIAGASKLKLVILDACRNTIFPLAGNRRSATRGLARIEPEDNTLVAYAAKDGTVAQDGAGAKHSPFTAALLKHLPTPGLEVRFLLAEVRDDVVAKTNREQTPHVYGTIGAEPFYLSAGEKIQVTDTANSSEIGRLNEAKARLQQQKQRLELLKQGTTSELPPRHENAERTTAILPRNVPIDSNVATRASTDPRLRSPDPIRITEYTLETTRKDGSQLSQATITPIGGGLFLIEDKTVNKIRIFGTTTTQNLAHTYASTQFWATIGSRTTISTSQDGTFLSRNSSSGKVIAIDEIEGAVFPMKVGGKFGFRITSEAKDPGTPKTITHIQKIGCLVKSERGASDFYPTIPSRAFVVSCQQRYSLLGQTTTTNWSSVYFEYLGVFLDVDPHDLSERITDPNSITRIKKIGITR